MVAARQLVLWQCDVKNAFLHGTIDRELYIAQPEGYKDGSGTVLRLNKSLYGLKQSPLCWFTALQRSLMSLGFQSCPVEPALFYKDFSSHSSSSGASVRCWVVVYVDDLLLACAAEHVVQQVFNGLNSSFLLKRIDPVDSYLGLQIVKNIATHSLFLHQQRYLAQATATTGPGSAHTPLTFNLRLDHDASPAAVDRTTYLSKVGRVSYASAGAHPDLTFPHSWLSSGNQQRTLQFDQEAERMLRYMRET